jgi:uncharacterized protein (TIGR02217 family)
MSNYIFPTLPGLTFDSVRSPNFNTGLQKAITSKESRIAYQQYVQWKWELTYELLRDYVTPSELKALVGLFIAVQGSFDTFLYSDPVFNSVTAQQFAVCDGTAGPFQITATYQNTGGTGPFYSSGPELIQNFNGTPLIYANGVLQTPTAYYTLDGRGGVTFTSGRIPASGVVLTWTGSFYYRVRFDDDSMDVSQFMANFWELKKLRLIQVKL